VIFLVSGGGSSLLSLPAPTIQMADKQQINKALLRSGAAIDEINCVRKHLSAIKGGRLALACEPATTLTLAISDVPGDDPAVIASGPTVADSSTSAEAIAILQRYDIPLLAKVEAWLRDPASESIKPEQLDPHRHQYQLIATPAQSLAAAQGLAHRNGVEVIYLGDDLEGESRELAASQAAQARSCLGKGRPSLILSGGETTVTLRGNGRGGRNTEFLLALANELQGEADIYALAADTDGIDGSEDNAGAILRPDSWQRAKALGLDADAMLNNNDSYGFFKALDDLFITGPTLTNVNDFRAIYISG
jgi:glycerate 2-kinase